MTCYVAAGIREEIKLLFISKKCQKWKMKDKNLSLFAPLSYEGLVESEFDSTGLNEFTKLVEHYECNEATSMLLHRDYRLLPFFCVILTRDFFLLVRHKCREHKEVKLRSVKEC